MILANILSLAGFLFLRFANIVALLYTSRIVGGVSFGLCFAIISPYIAEISQPKIRKFTVPLMPVFYNTGFIITFLLSTFLDWKTIVSIIIFSPCINIICLFFCPESPTWLMLKGNKEMAVSCMLSMRGDANVANKELERIEKNLEKQKEAIGTQDGSSAMKRKWDIMSKGTFIRPFLTVVMLLGICWHWTGGPFIGFYVIDMIEKLKVPMNPYWCAVLIASFQLVFGLLGTFTSSILTRRKMFVGGGILEATGTFVCGLTVYLNRKVYSAELLDEYPFLRWIPLVGLLIFYAGYFGGYVPVCFMALAELLPSNARSVGSSMATSMSILSLFILIKFALSIEDAIGLDGTFWMFSIVGWLSILFYCCFVPETFGKTLESIEDYYRKLCNKNKVSPKPELPRKEHTVNINIDTRF